MPCDREPLHVGLAPTALGGTPPTPPIATGGSLPLPLPPTPSWRCNAPGGPAQGGVGEGSQGAGGVGAPLQAALGARPTSGGLDCGERERMGEVSGAGVFSINPPTTRSEEVLVVMEELRVHEQLVQPPCRSKNGKEV